MLRQTEPIESDPEWSRLRPRIGMVTGHRSDVFYSTSELSSIRIDRYEMVTHAVTVGRKRLPTVHKLKLQKRAREGQRGMSLL